MRSLLISVLVVFSCFLSNAQDHNHNHDHSHEGHDHHIQKVSFFQEKILQKKQEGHQFSEVNVFNLSIEKSADVSIPELNNYALLDLSKEGLKKINADKPSTLTLNIPNNMKTGTATEIELIQVDPFRDDITFKSLPSGKPVKYSTTRGIHYQGVVKGEDNSIVAVSFFDNDVMGLISSPSTKGNVVLGKVESAEKSLSEKYIIYEDGDIAEYHTLECGSLDPETPYTKEELAPSAQAKSIENCIGIYLEVEHDVYLRKTDLTGTIDYITGLFNQVALLYKAEDIKIVISELAVWEEETPYSGTAYQVLSQFRARHVDNSFNGDLAHLINNRNFGGIAYTNVLCWDSYAYGVSDIGMNYKEVPTYSWSVNVIAHELGHNFGSAHTHACLWNSNGTQIDDCGNKYYVDRGYSAEGKACYDEANPILPTLEEGGTVMSYCHLLSTVKINFSNGFGEQPGNLIRNYINNANCLVSCDNYPSDVIDTCGDGEQNGDEEGVDCGGSSCEPCATPCAVAVKTFLQGCYGADMSGDAPAVPTTTPYSVMVIPHNILEETNQEIITEYGIIDWVLIELRDPTNPANVVATRSGLLKANGNVVDMDGVSALEFTCVSPGDYYLAVQHRNHLGMMTASKITLSGSCTSCAGNISDENEDTGESLPVKLIVN